MGAAIGRGTPPPPADPALTPPPPPLPSAPPDAAVADAAAALATAVAGVPAAAPLPPALRLARSRGGAPLDPAARCADLPTGCDLFVVDAGVVAEPAVPRRPPLPAPSGAPESEAFRRPPSATAVAAALALPTRRARAAALAALPGPAAAAARVNLLLEAGRSADALAAASAARERHARHPALALALAAALAACGDHEDAFEAFQAASELAGEDSPAAVDAAAGAAKAALAAGNPDVAAAAITGALQLNKDHGPSLILYARIAQTRGMLRDTARALVRALAADRAAAGAPLAELTATDAGLAALETEIDVMAGRNAAQGALIAAVAGVALADAGAPAAASAVLARAVDARPGDAGAVLALAQALEAAGDGRGALAAVAAWCAVEPRAPRTLPGALADALIGLPDGKGGVEWLLEEGWPEAGVEKAPHAAPAQPLSGPALDAYALAGLAVRLLFVGGALCRAAAVADAMAAAGADLSATRARNEAAYAALVSSLAADPARRGTGAEAPLYAVGDSHCLPLAWRRVVVRARERILVPRLAPGATAWGARAGGPTSRGGAAWWAALAGVPRGEGEVVATLGALDAAAFLPAAVDSLRYPSLTAAAAATAAAAVAGLDTAAAGKGVGRLWLHSVVSVAGDAAATLNALLRAAAAARPRLAWLEADVDSGERVDGVHLRAGDAATAVERALGG